jgi:hypothetical protein
MLEKLKSLFSRKKVLSEDDLMSAKKMASFTINVNVDNTTDLIYDWPDWTPDNQASAKLIATSLAQALFTLTNGALSKDMVDTLISYECFNTTDKVFVDTTVGAWANMDNMMQDQLKGQNTPIIKPREAFK